jgi:hypothetical protein
MVNLLHLQTPPSIGLMTNGLNILDQMGMIDNINRYNVKRKVWERRDVNGNLRTSFNL